MYGDGEEEEENDEENYDNDEYMLDDSLNPMDKLEKYKDNDLVTCRQSLARILADTVKFAGIGDTRSKVLPAMDVFAKDPEPMVREALCSQMPLVVQFLLDADEQGYEDLLTRVLPLNMRLLVDKNAQVQERALESMLQLAEKVKVEDRGEKIVKLVTEVFGNDEKRKEYMPGLQVAPEDCRIVEATLLGELAALVGQEHAIASFIPEALTLSNDDRVAPRKAIAMSIGKLMTVCGDEASVEKLMPIWETLSGHDDWSIRKACVENITEVSKAVTADCRKGPLLKRFMELREDKERWVKVQCNNSLAPFMYTFPNEDVSDELVTAFCELAGKEGEKSAFSERCAHFFPAVAASAGKDRWSTLEPVYTQLSQDPNYKVRRSLSFSIHEVAKALGPEVTKSCLTKAWGIFLSDLDEVKVGCVTSAAAFLEVLEEGDREEQIAPLVASLQSMEDWRLRALVAKQLGKIAPLVSDAVAKKLLADPVYQLVTDQVAEVRDEAHPSCAMVLARLGESNSADLKKKIDALNPTDKSESHFQQRQIFARVAGFCVREGAHVEHYVDELEKCAKDDVVNVRIAAACAMENCTSSAICDAKIQEIIDSLSGDSNLDVQRFAAAAKAA